MNEGELATAIKAAQLGNRDAFAAVYRQFSNRVLGLCRRLLGSAAAAEDATSEVFEKAAGALDRYDPERPFDRWILAVASRHCLNQLRRQRKERQLFAEESVDPPASTAASSPLAACEDQEQQRQVRSAIDALPDAYRSVLVLKYYGDLSYAEIAEQLGISATNVAVLLHRAKRALRGGMHNVRGREP